MVGKLLYISAAVASLGTGRVAARQVSPASLVAYNHMPLAALDPVSQPCCASTKPNPVLSPPNGSPPGDGISGVGITAVFQLRPPSDVR